MKSDLIDVPTAIKLSHETIKNIKQNLFWAFGYNTIGRQTPGREVEIEIGDKVSEKEKNLKLSHGNFSYMAKQIIKNCGG
ncbi:hypothetical protein ACTPD5_21130, partial [Clostridioides difficile]